jgi:uncharacterized protein YlxP (DUF503 family)
MDQINIELKNREKRDMMRNIYTNQQQMFDLNAARALEEDITE